jgi:exodeoxyribonuclease VII small subunit
MSDNAAEAKPSFEAAFTRLEEILNQINSAEISLDVAVALYEEADGLIARCSKRLNEAEQRIEVLIKNRQGELQLAEDRKARTQPINAFLQDLENVTR